MTRQLHAAMAAGNLAEAGTLAMALAGLGELSVMDLIGVAGLMAAQGRTEQTIALYTLWLKHCDSPLEYVAWYNLAVVQTQGQDDAGAERAYRKSLELRPGFTESQLGLGMLLERKRQPEAALALWREALDLLEAVPPGAPPAAASLQVRLLNNIGRLAEAQGDPAQAEDALLRSLQLDPKQRLIVPRWLDLRLKLCAWPVHGFVPGLSETALQHHTSALAMLSLGEDPARQLACARREAALYFPPPSTALSDQDGYVHRKLRVGYLSCGFGAQPTGRMVAELLELHDRDQVEVYGFCWSGEDHSALRQRLLRAFDLHVPIGQLSDLQAAQAIRAHEIDILVDLHGVLPGGRPGILGHRPAPVQIAWLGQAGTSGNSRVDYVLADSFVLPPELAGYHTEKPLYLPHCFQPQDRQRPLPRPPAPGTRAEFGLPDEAFVFCCFGAAGHIVPERFATWMRILHAVPGSVLWLQTDSEQVRDNLRLAALRHDISSDRLCFSGSATGELAMDRHRAADLFLDTGPHNADAIAGDVLWAGLPLLTRAGPTFASRVCGSLLQAAGLPELIARTEKQYANKAIRLATHPKELARLRNRLDKNRADAPLFDTPALARDLERLYLRVARGTLKRSRRKAAQQAATPPLVSILIPADDPLPLSTTLASALAQTHANCEVIVSDSSEQGACLALLKPLLKAHRRLRYSHAPGLGALDNLNHCLALALGEYVAVAPAGDTMAPEKIAVMLPCFIDHPNVRLVAGWRQPRAPDGAPLPAAPLFPNELLIDGASLANMLLGGDIGDNGAAAAMCAPAALLFKRATLGQAFGRYGGHAYPERANVATALAALAGGDYVYLPQALSACPAAPAPGVAAPSAALDAALESLRLLHQAREQGHDFGAPARFKELLSARLSELNVLVSTRYPQLAATAGDRLDAVQRAMRLAYQQLLAP